MFLYSFPPLCFLSIRAVAKVVIDMLLCNFLYCRRSLSFRRGASDLTQHVNTPSQDCSSSPLTTRLIQLHPEEEVSRRRSVCRQQIGVNGSTKQQTLTQQARDCLNRFFLIHDHCSSLTPGHMVIAVSMTTCALKPQQSGNFNLLMSRFQ